MTITMSQIKELRASSGAGMMDVKKALELAGKQQTANSKQLAAAS